MKIICLLLTFSSSVIAQFTHIEITQSACPSSHCYSSPAISENDKIAYIDTQNGITAEQGTRLMSFNSNEAPIPLITNQNDFISDVKMDSSNQIVVKIGNQIVRYPNQAIVEPIAFENIGPAANEFSWKGDTSIASYYPSLASCEDGITLAHQIVSATIHTFSHEVNSVMTNHRLLADGCSDTPEPFVSSNFVRVSDNGKNKIYALFVNGSQNTTSRLYLHQQGQADRIIADDVTIAEVNDANLAVWATETNNQISIYQQSMDDFAPPPVLLDQIAVPIGFSYNIIDLSNTNSGDIAYLLRIYQINTQTFSYQLNVKRFSVNSFHTMLATGQSIGNKMIDEIRWNHHGINNFGTIVSSVKFVDGTEALFKSLTREAQTIGFDVKNALFESQGIYHLGHVSVHDAYKTPAIVADAPVHQNHQIENSFMRIEDEYFEQGSSNLITGQRTTTAFSVVPPDLFLDEINTYHQISQTFPNTVIEPQTIAIKYVEPTQFCVGICIVICLSNISQEIMDHNKVSNTLDTTYQRLKTELLELTPTGNHYLNIYYQNFPAIRDAMYSEPLSFGLFYNLFQSWQAAIENLLDGDGSYIITAEMSTHLNDTLDLIERNSNSQLKTLLNNSRNSMNLYSLTGMTIGGFMTNEFENSFEDVIFVDGFN